ncbi:MAG: DUF6580 family putative transport protein [Bacteroidota bacterium]
MRKINLRTGLLISMIAGIAICRLIPHPANFSPVGAMALFGGAYFTKKWQAYLIPLAALFVSDIFVNYLILQEWMLFHSVAFWVYGALAVNVLLARKLIKKIRIIHIAGTGLLGSLLFFAITNFGVWYTDVYHMYPDTPQGLAMCLTAGIPYLWRTMAGDLFFITVLFGMFELLKYKYPVALSPVKY